MAASSAAAAAAAAADAAADAPPDPWTLVALEPNTQHLPKEYVMAPSGGLQCKDCGLKVYTTELAGRRMKGCRGEVDKAANCGFLANHLKSKDHEARKKARKQRSLFTHFAALQQLQQQREQEEGGEAAGASSAAASSSAAAAPAGPGKPCFDSAWTW